VLQLDEDVAALRDLAGGLASAPTARSIGEGAEQLGRVLVSLSELLHHPLAQEPLQRLGRSPFAERLLDDFLRLADAHGSFRAVLVSLAALQAEARAALRREDGARLASAARGLRRSGRDLPRIASSARAVAGKAPPPAPAGLPSDSAALAAAVVDAAAAVASASAAVFSGVSALSVAAATARVVDVVSDSAPCWMPSPARFASSSASPRTSHHVVVTTKPSSMRIWWVADLMRWMSRAKRRSASKQHADVGGSSTQQTRSEATLSDPEEEDRKAAFERMDNLGRCIEDVENSGEQVFRALVNTRVSLLNILSPTI
jgi:hypothetical protein